MQSSYSQLSKILDNDPDTFKIMISTDTHLGYKDNHHIRRGDSFNAFEEVLQYAKEYQSDFLLLGGDLFHEINPSQETLYRTIKILAQKIYGPKQIDYQVFWENQPPNFANENMNIDLPIFIIHGNHDYPSNEYDNLSVLDLLSAGQYVYIIFFLHCYIIISFFVFFKINYFGKYLNLEEIIVTPILFHKGETKIALYGIGHIKDLRLNHLLQNKKVIFKKPDNYKEYFNILIIHQNRFKGIRPQASYKNCIHPELFPSFINLLSK